jgi:PAS domain S-box-containing protein
MRRKETARTPEQILLENKKLRLHLKEAGEYIKEQELQFRSFIESSPDGIIIRREGCLLYANSAALKIYGVKTIAQLRNKTIPGLTDREEPSKKIRRHQKGLATNLKLLKEARLVTHDDIVRNVEVVVSRINYKGEKAEQITIRDIDKLKSSEESLSASEAKYRELVENSRTIILKMDYEGKFTFVNEFAQKFFGYSEEEIIGKTAFETIVPKVETTGRNLAPLIKNIYDDPDKFTININENKKRDGTRVWIEWHNKALFNNEGKRIGHLAIGIDISERKQAELKLTENEQLYRAIGESIEYGIWICDPDGRNTYASESFLNLVGITQEQCSEFGWGKVLHPDDAEHTIAAWKECVSTGATWNREHRFKGVDGNWHPILARGIPVKNEKDEIRCWAGINLDISQLRTAEEQLKKTNEKLNLALENGNIGTWEWDIDTGIVIVDERINSIFGFEPGTSVITYEDFEKRLVEEDVPHMREAARKTIEENVPFETVYRIWNLRGDDNYISSKAILKRDNGVKPLKMTGVCYDVTAMQKDTEKVLVKLNEELLRSNKDLQQFAYAASHDLQEPLRMVSSFTQMLAQRYESLLDENGKEYIKYAVDGSKRMYDLINGLLAYSRVQTKGKEFAIIHLKDVVEKVIKNLKLKISERGAKISFSKLPSVYADEHQMIQLIQNLLENSLKFSTSAPVITISSKSNNSHFTISIRDNGIGIEPQYFERIFMIFQRLHLKEEFDGTGIGLAICKRIVERHDGKIWIESVPGKGTTFFFTIPKFSS